MNQAIKERVYRCGSKKQAEYMANISGMSEEQRRMLMLLHDGKPDDFIMDTMGLSRKSYKRIEESMRMKLLLAVFQCINWCMDNEMQ